MTVNILFDNFVVYVLVFARMSGMLFLNPIMMRKNLPMQFKIALVLGITIITAPFVNSEIINNINDFQFVLMIVSELLIGAACGYMFQLYYYMLFAAGDIIDMGFGLSMAKAFDPGTNIQISATGNIFQMMFVLYFFMTNSHLVFIKLMTSSYDIVGMGLSSFGSDVASFMLTLFTSAFLLVMQLALPFISATFVLEMVMGILMKLVPQINVFSIHFQIKIISGIILMFIFAGPVSSFMQDYISTVLIQMQDLLAAFKV